MRAEQRQSPREVPVGFTAGSLLADEGATRLRADRPKVVDYQ